MTSLSQDAPAIQRVDEDMTPQCSSADSSKADRLSRIIIGLSGALALIVSLAYGYYIVFSRSMSLDEGYLMITVQGFNSGHALYDVVFTQYGPLYYFYEWLLRSVFGVPLTHDATRMLCVFHWLVASSVLGLASWKMTRSAFAGLFVAMLAVVRLSSIANEPGHPQELVVVLLALGTWAASRFARGRWTLEALALITALLVFTKINVGIFFGFALLLAMRCHSSDRFARGAWQWLLLAVCAALPFVLMRRHLTEPWCRNFGVLAAGTVVTAMFVAGRVANRRTLGAKKYFTMAGVFGITTAALVAVTLLAGTSWKGLIDGLLLTPLKMPKVALLALPLANAVLLNGLVSWAAAVFVMRKSDSRTQYLLVALKIAYVIAGAFCLVDDAKNQFAWLLPWVWLGAMPLGTERKWNPEESFARLFLVLGAAWQSLQAYPIAGTQVTLGTLLLVLAYGVCANDVARQMAQTSRIREFLAALTPTKRLLVHGLAGVGLIFFFANIWCKLPAARIEHAKLRPLDLPGSHYVRMDDETVEMYRALSQYLAAESGTFVTYPGINSLYLWTGQRPPTQLNSTGWGQLSHAQQQHILGSLAKAERPKIAVVEAMMGGWASPAYDPIRPLIRYITEDCQPLKRIGRFVIFEPKASVTSNATR
jgi:hypothetical protein